MKIALAQCNYIIGDFEGNLALIKDSLGKAKEKQAELVIFSELAICGYPPHDLLEHRIFLEKCDLYIRKAASFCTDIAAIIGGPSINESGKGKALYNSAFFCYEGKIEQVIHKSLLPTYDIFDEYRYFEPNTEFNIVTFKNKKLAITICEDLWYDQPVFTDFGRNKLYKQSPAKILRAMNPDLIVNIAASPFSYKHEEIKREILTVNAKQAKIPVLYVNQVGANTELIFDGGSLVINSQGVIVDKLAFFREDLHVVESDEIVAKLPVEQIDSDYIDKIYKALVMGVKDYFYKSGFSKATLGLSGGIDSAVTLAIATEALGAPNMRVLLMPSRFSSDHSVSDSVQLAKNLNVHHDIIPIHELVKSFDSSLRPVFKNIPPDITEENIQARIRGILLMAISNKYGHILLNTSNKSEASVGYGTLYGDMNGGLSVLGDIYKKDVYKLAHYINRFKEVIPENIIQKPPSAELRPDQKDTDSLPEYDILDKILFHYIELQEPPDNIINQGFNKEVVRWVINKVNTNEHKRFQTPPILRVSSKAFGIGRRMPLVAKYDF